MTLRPETALSVDDIGIGSKIVCYGDGRATQEVQIVGIEEAVDFGEIIELVRYKIIGDKSGTIFEAEPSSLGLSPMSDGTQHWFAVPFDEQ